MYTALYRKWRPEIFSAMSGQSHIIKILKNQLTGGQVGHAYLFCGTRGTGKTTTARILAKGVNCLADQTEKPCGMCENCMEIQEGRFIDVIEIDAASNNGVDNIRELRESVKYPSVKGKYKVYIIDEVHMLSSGAFNALLKTLEEPPEHVIFILATTEIHKLPPTIVSRCMRLDFRRLSEKEIKDRLQEVCAHNEVQAEESALTLIAANADGAMRDALGILDQCFSAVEDRLTRSDVVDILGTAGEETFIEITDQLISKSAPQALMTIERIAADGRDIRQFLKDWIHHFRNLMIAKYADQLENILNLSCENIEKIKKQSEQCPMEFISLAIMELSKASAEARWSAWPRILLEMAVIRLADLREETSLDGLAARVADLEKKLMEAKPVASVSFDATLSPDIVSKAKKTTTKMTSGEKTALSGTPNAPDTPNTSGTPKAPDMPKTPDISDIPTQDILKSDMDLEALWKQIFSQGTARKVTFNMLAKGVKIIAVDEKTITLEAETPAKKTSVEQNAPLIAEILSSLTGKNLKVICIQADKQPKATAAADEVVQKLGRLIDADKLVITD